MSCAVKPCMNVGVGDAVGRAAIDQRIDLASTDGGTDRPHIGNFLQSRRASGRSRRQSEQQVPPTYIQAHRTIPQSSLATEPIVQRIAASYRAHRNWQPLPPKATKTQLKLQPISLLIAVLMSCSGGRAWAADAAWDPFPVRPHYNDFGGVGLLQVPSARFAADGAIAFSFNKVSPYSRYSVTMQALPSLEVTLRYASISNRLFSDSPEFSGDQSFKDRGFDAKLRLFSEGQVRPEIAVGLRDFIGTGTFQAEYIVGSKEIGPFDLTFGVGWGRLGTRAHIKNPSILLSDSFRTRPGFVSGGGTFNASYFRGPGVAFFGGLRYDTPIPGLTAIVEYDPNNYQSEALGNKFRVSSPVNVGINYQARSWLAVGASWERGNKFGVKLVFTGNINDFPKFAKIDAPAPPFTVGPQPAANDTPPSGTPAPKPPTPAVVPEAPLPRLKPASTDILVDDTAQVLGAEPKSVETPEPGLGKKLETALINQGGVLLAARFSDNRATLYVAQTRFRDMAMGVGRLSRAAFSVLPPEITAVKTVLIEGGMPTMGVTVYRHLLQAAISENRGSADELLIKTNFEQALPTIQDVDHVGAALTRGPRFFYGIAPSLRTTLGRPEQFILYQAWIRLNGALEVKPGLQITGSYGYNVSDNFGKLRNRSDSVLPRVRSDIDQYLKIGRSAITHLQADYHFAIAPGLYGHVFGGLLEEMFAGAGAELLYRPFDSNFAIGVDLSWVRQRNFEGYFGFQKYNVFTGHVTMSYNFKEPNITATVRAGRYLAKDIGATFELSRTFKSGATIGAFATFTDVSAADFGEGRFDKGIFISVPLDLFYPRSLRNGLGIAYRPLIRDGGQQLIIRQPLLGATSAATLANFRRDWRNIGK